MKDGDNGWVSSDGPPVFVVGASRSGTALLRSALNKHRDVFLAGETHYFDDLRPTLRHRGLAPIEDEERARCEDYFLSLAHRPFGHGGVAAQSRLDRQELRQLAERLGGGGDGYFQAYCNLARQLEPQAAASPLRWGEKTPRHVFRLGEILQRYPGAQAICMYRDPRAVVASYRDWRHQGGFDLENDVDHAMALESEHRRTSQSYDPSIVSLLWRTTVKAGHQARARFGPDRVLLQRYEDIASDPEASFRLIAGWLGMEFEPAMLDVPHHNSSYNQFQGNAGVSTAPVERWKSTLDPQEIAVVQGWCRRDMARMGYDAYLVSLAPVATVLLLLKLPFRLLRAAAANAGRMGSIPRYVWRRVSLLLSSS